MSHSHDSLRTLGGSERSHPTWKTKIRLQLDELSKDSTYHWAQNLNMIARCYNEGLHSALGMTPFEVFYGRRSNRERNMLVVGQTPVPSDQIQLEEEDTIQDLQAETSPLDIAADHGNLTTHFESIEQVRKRAKLSNDKEAEKMIKRNIKRNPPSVYHVGEKVFIPVPRAKGVNRGGRSISKPLVHLATILEVYPETYRYKIRYSDDVNEITKVVSVSELTSITREDEQRRQKLALDAVKKPAKKKGSKIQKKTTASKNSYNMSSPVDIVRFCNDISKGISLSLKQPVDSSQLNLDRHIEEAGLSYVEPRTPKDGNCMFHALAEQLRIAGIAEINYQELRTQLVKYLTEHKDTAGGVHMLDFTGYSTWNQYLEYMSRDGIWGDQIILIAASNLFRAQITIISSVPSNPVIIIEPENSPPQDAPVLLIGHVSEFHYYSLRNNDDDESMCIPQQHQKSRSGKRKRKLGKSQPSNSKVNKENVDWEYIDQLISDVSTISRGDVLNRMEVPVDGHFNCNYTRYESIETSLTLLGISDTSRYFEYRCKELNNTIIPIQNGHYCLSPEQMDMYCGYRERQKDDNIFVLYIDIVLVYWLYKNKKLHYLKKTSVKVEDRFLFVSSVEQDAFRRFKEALLEDWNDML